MTEKTEDLIAEARLAACSECSEEGTSPAMRCDGDLIRRLADALEAAEARLAALTTPQEPESAHVGVERDTEMGGVACSECGWHLAGVDTHSGARSLEQNQREHDEHFAAPQEGEARELAALRRVWKAMGCAQNPDDFKSTVRDAMWDQIVAGCESHAANDTRIYRENQSLLAELLELKARAAAPEPEWEYGCRSSAHHEPVTFVIGLDVDEPQDHGFDCPSPALVRRRKAGLWETLTVGGEN